MSIGEVGAAGFPTFFCCFGSGGRRAIQGVRTEASNANRLRQWPRRKRK
jgi:hypothetical protein